MDGIDCHPRLWAVTEMRWGCVGADSHWEAKLNGRDLDEMVRWSSSIGGY